MASLVSEPVGTSPEPRVVRQELRVPCGSNSQLLHDNGDLLGFHDSLQYKPAALQRKRQQTPRGDLHPGQAQEKNSSHIVKRYDALFHMPKPLRQFRIQWHESGQTRVRFQPDRK